MIATGKFSDPFQKPFLKEFTLSTNIAKETIQTALLENGIFGGMGLDVFGEKYEGLVNFSVTEKRTKAEIDKLVSILEALS